PLGNEMLAFFKAIGEAIQKAFSGDHFTKLNDAINTGLFATLVALLAKFEAGGLRLGTRNVQIVAQIGQVFSQLRYTMTALQVELKAETLLKIAIALAVLAVSIIALSLID